MSLLQTTARLARSIVVIAPLICCAAARVTATPMTWGDKITVPLKWPKGPLKVYIKPDPKALGRDALVKEGVERWKAPLAARGITLDVTIGDPPANAVTPITYTWEADNFEDHGQKLGNGNDAIAGPDGRATGGGNGEFTSGTAHLRNALPAGGDDDKNYLKNLAEHEFVHILGIADDDNGEVTRHAQGSDARGLSELDLKELNSLYGTAQTNGNSGPRGHIQKLGGGSQDGFWEYAFTLQTANAVPSLDDPEHVAFIAFAIDTSLVSGLLLPPGWIGLIGGHSLTPDDPFFAEGYMVDAFTGIPPWSTTDPLSYIALRTSVAEAAHDGLPPGFDPALTLANPVLLFRLLTSGPVGEGAIAVWAGGDSQLTAGPVALPEPASWLLFGTGIALLTSRRLQSWRSATSGFRREARRAGP